jgi:hypothetical protein
VNAPRAIIAQVLAKSDAVPKNSQKINYQEDWANIKKSNPDARQCVDGCTGS